MRLDRRLLHHVLQVEFFVGLIIVAQIDWAGKTAAWWATSFQFVGAVVTFGGLLWAYIRARTGLGLWELFDRVWARTGRWLNRLLRRRRNVMIRVGPAVAIAGMGTPTVEVGFGRLDYSLPIQEQLEQLANAIRNLESWFNPIRADQRKIRHEIDTVRTLAESSTEQAIAHIEAKVERLTADLNKGQTLDLRWAIGGLLISAIGTFLQYLA